MDPLERAPLTAVAETIALTILGDAVAASAIAHASVDWVEAHPAEVGGHLVPWVATQAVRRALDAPAPVGRPHDRPREVLAEELRAQPTATRVALALVGMCGYDLATTAGLTRRPVDQIRLLLAPFADIVDDLAVLRTPVAAAPSAPPPPAPWDLPAPAAAPAPPAAPPATTRPERRRRRLPVSAGTLVAVGIIVGTVLVITVPNGPRPTLAAPAADDAGTCDQEPFEATTLRLPPDDRPARLTLPPGRVQHVPLVVVIGESGQSAEDTNEASGMEAAANAGGFATLTLDGAAQPWNVTSSADRADDVALVRAAIDAAAGSNCIDPSRTVLVGYGVGAHLAAAAACSGLAQLGGVVMVRGAYAPAACQLDHPVPVVIDTDTTDAILPFDGGWGISAAADGTYQPTGTAAAFDAWSGFNGCDPTATKEASADGVTASTRATCEDGVTVRSRVATGYGHDWPKEATGEVVRLVGSLR